MKGKERARTGVREVLSGIPANLRAFEVRTVHVSLVHELEDQSTGKVLGCVLMVVSLGSSGMTTPHVVPAPLALSHGHECRNSHL